MAAALVAGRGLVPGPGPGLVPVAVDASSTASAAQPRADCGDTAAAAGHLPHRRTTGGSALAAVVAVGLRTPTTAAEGRSGRHATAAATRRGRERI